MSEPALEEKAAVMRCLPALMSAGGGMARLQRFQLVRADPQDATQGALLGFKWISQHRYRDRAMQALGSYLAAGVRAHLFDLQTAEFVA